jgi:hypothetical protein
MRTLIERLDRKAKPNSEWRLVDSKPAHLGTEYSRNCLVS